MIARKLPSRISLSLKHKRRRRARLRLMRIERLELRQVLAGEVAVFLGSTEIRDGQDSVSFGATDLADRVQRTFVVRNLGADPLTVKPVSVPAGFRLLEDLSDATPILFGGQSQFTVEMDTTAGGDYVGTIRFATSDPDENPFDFQVVGSVATNKGTDFWLAFQPNDEGTPTLTLSLASDVATSGRVTIVSPPFNQAFTTTPGVVTTVAIPSNVVPIGATAIAAANHTISNRAIRVTADAPVSVLGLNRQTVSTDGFLGLPANVLGKEYLVMTYGAVLGVNGQQVSIVGTEDNTTVTIVPTATTGPWVRNVPVTVTLNRGQLYYAMNRSTTNNFLGMEITSDKPIAVFAGHSLAQIPAGQTFADHLTEQLPPVDTWGAEFVVAPLLTRPDYRLRIMAAFNGTEVRRNGTLVTTINRGQFHEFELPGAAYIQTSRPALAMQFSEGATGGFGDPFMQVVPPVDQFSSNYILATPNVAAFSGRHNVNVIVPTSAIGVITRNGTVIPASQFTSVPGTTFSYAQMNVPSGTHQFASSGIPFGLTMYGWGRDESYGFLGGQVFRRSDIDVRVDGVGISSGQGTIDYGTVGLGTTAQKTFTIRNSTSVGELQLGTISVPNGFTMVVPPDKTLLRPGEVTSIVIGLRTDALGRQAGELTIVNSDRDENPFRISLAGTVASPKFELLDGAAPIINGSTVNFAPVPLNDDQSRTLTIRNTGPVDLSIGSVTLSGDGVFSVTQPDSTLLRPGAQTTFVLRHAATQPGQREALVSISNNDVQGNPFTFPVVAFAYDQVDLSVTEITVPTTLAWGTEVEVAWTLTNLGSGEFRGTFRDEVLISADQNLGGDQTLGTADFSGAILPGQSIARKARFNLPPAVVGTRYFVVATDSTFRVRESIENNNALIDDRGLEVLASDLVPSHVEAASVIPTGTQTQVRWRVTNSGQVPTPSGATWTDAVYLSGDDVLDGNDTLLATVANPQALAAGESYTNSALVNIAYGTYGNKHFIVKSDAGISIVEASEVNNLASTNTNIHWVPPDLQVTRVVSQAVAFTGAPTIVTWEVRNEGLASMLPSEATWRDRVWISKNTQLDSSDLPLGEFDRTGLLVSGASYSRTVNVTVPLASALPAGDYYLIVQTDSQQQVKEGPFEVNNVTAARAVTRIVHAPPPDLVVQRVGPPPSTAYAGQTIPVDFTIINAGAGATEPTNRSWIDRVYLSSNDIFDANDIFLGGLTRNGGLVAGESYNRQGNVLIPPSVEGTFKLLVVTNANQVVFGDDTSNNSRVSSQTLTILKPPADLVAWQIDVPKIAAVNQKFKVGFDVRNSGAQATTVAAWTDRVYLSTDRQWDGNDQLLASIPRTAALAVDASYNAFAEVSIAATGEYYVIVRGDADDQVFELDNLNNTRATLTQIKIVPTPANLQPTQLLVPEFAAVGSQLPIEFRVTNAGPNATLATRWIDRVYLSTDQTLDSQDRLVSSLSRVEGLEASPDFYDTALNVPLDLSLAGQYYVIVHSDAMDDVFELQNDDNIAVSPNRITILTEFPDLVITQARVPNEANTGDIILVDWVVRNMGDRDTLVSSWRERVYLSTDVSFSSTDRLLGEFSYTHQAPEGGPGPLAAAGIVERREQVELPNDLPGGLFIFVVVDATDLVFEYQREQNNVTLANPITVVPRSVDLQVPNVTAPENVTEGVPFVVSWTVRNAGNNSTTANYWYDDVYLSTDPTLSQDDVRLSTTRRSAALFAAGNTNDSYSTLANVAVPIGAVQATDPLRYILVKTDAGNPQQVYEVDEQNNSRATATPIRVQPGSPVPLPNLQVTNVAVSGSGQGGQPLEVEWSVTNLAASMQATASWIDTVYLSLDQVLDTTGNNRDIYLGYVAQTRLLANNEVYTQSTIVDIPKGLSGDYYLLVMTDQNQKLSETLETDNVGSSRSVPIAPLPPADLIVGDINVPSSELVGRPVTITYTITNASSTPAVGNWYDAVYLSADDAWDADDIFFGRALHRDGLEVLASYSQSITAPLPGMLPGPYRVIVRSDLMNNLVESNEENNVRGSLDRVAVDVPLLTAGVSTQRSLGNAESAYYKIVVPNDRTLSIKVDSLGTTGDVQIFVSKDAIPSRSRFDYTAGELGKVDQQLLVPDTQAATYYVLVYRASNPVDNANLTIQADLIGFSLLSSDITRVGNAGSATLSLSGAQLRGTQSVALVDATNTTRRAASRFVATSSTSLYVTFELTGLALGSYRLEAINTSGEVATLATPIQVESLRSSAARLALTTPERARLGQTFEVSVTVFNDGNVDVAAPLVQFDSQSTLLLGYGAHDLQDELLTVAIVPPGGYRDVIRPGQAIPVTITAREKSGQPGEAKLKVRSAGQSANPLNLRPMLDEEAYSQAFGNDADLMRELISGYETSSANQIARDIRAAGAVNLPGDVGFVDAAYARRNQLAMAAQLAEHFDLSQLLLKSQQSPSNAPPPSRKPLEGVTFQQVGSTGSSGKTRFILAGFLAGDPPELWTYAMAARLKSICENDTIYIVRWNSGSVEELESEVLKGLGVFGLSGAAFNLQQYYAKMAEKTPALGEAIAQEILRTNLNPRDVVIYGHSLGAQAAGFAGSILANHPAGPLGQIVGFDPAGPGFGGDDKRGHLDASDATLVQVINTSSALGRYRCDGDETYYVTRPGTENVSFDPIASHSYSHQWYFDRLLSPDAATACKGSFRPDTPATNCPLPDRDIGKLEGPDAEEDRTISIVRAFDPNDMLGPVGFGPERWVAVTTPLNYTIRFENDPRNATAPAQRIDLITKLDSDLDFRSFRLGDFGWGDLTVQVPDNRAYFATRLDLVESRGIYVDVFAGIDVTTGEAFWNFIAIDPQTGEVPEDPLKGILPPNNTSPEGEGFARYSIYARSESVTGTRVEAQTRIVFDINAPLDTPVIFNTIDAVAPTSQVLALPPEQVSDQAQVLVQWSGTDDEHGSAVRDYDIFVSTAGGPYRLWLDNVTTTQAYWQGTSGVSYAFYSVARDNAGMVEAFPGQRDTEVKITAEADVQLRVGDQMITNENNIVSFGTVIKDNVKVVRKFVITNTGPNVILVQPAELVQEGQAFELTSNIQSVQLLDAGRSIEVEVSMDASRVGELSATLEIPTNVRWKSPLRARLAGRAINAPALDVQLESPSIAEDGGFAIAKVRRDANDVLPKRVTLTSSDPNAASVPTTIDFPYSASVMTFRIQLADNQRIDPARSITIAATANGLSGANASFELLDDDQANVVLRPETVSLNENSGTATVDVELTLPSSTETILNLSSSDSSAIDVPGSIRIPAGQTRGSFTITARDNQVAQGAQSITVTATTQGYATGTTGITVIDDDVASLTLTLASSPVREGVGSVQATVMRNTPVDRPLTVNVVSSDPSVATVDPSVVFAAGSASATFVIQVIDDDRYRGGMGTTISVSAATFASGQAVLLVTDNDPNYPWTNLQLPEDVNASGSVTPLDALLLINEINLGNSGRLPEVQAGVNEPPPYYDVSRDGFLTPIDALMVINYINSRSAGEGEQPAVGVVDELFADLSWLEKKSSDTQWGQVET